MTETKSPKPPGRPPSPGLFVAGCSCGWIDAFKTALAASEAQFVHSTLHQMNAHIDGEATP